MKPIAILTGPLRVSGSNVAALDLAAELRRREIEVTVVAGDGPLADRFRAAGVPIRTFETSGRLPGDLPRLPELRRAILDSGAGLIHLATPRLLGVGRLLARLTRRPLVVNVTDPAAAKGIERSLRVRGILAPSRAARDELVIRHGVPRDRIVTVPATVDLGRFPDPGPPLAGEGIVLGALTRIDRQAGLTDLLEAVRLLLAGGSELHLLVVGQGPFAEPLRRMARDMGIQKHVTLTEVPKDFERILDTVDVFVHPRHREWTGYGILHAMAAARPVVAAGVGAAYSIVREAETGYLVPVGDPAALANRIEAVIRDPERGAEMGRAGRDEVARAFSAPRTADLLLPVYETVEGEEEAR